ncbi:aldo/keto reductase [Cylindrospermopsis raciborskii CENA303]|uniref:Aldo/keto reductase n=1 Tax=Cylindrospermopsis raciborskii CENA303 TaxID=1170769 RepID=A0A1X4G6F5_9CYAN|nr:aldo/keto reductase [Cylindrospermopsis raciborskii]OSO90612.1 aldo/keto reductase [Cylindrospermopsis raciborskii CENA303]
MRPELIALGTAQFGLSYGVANQKGQVPAREAYQILKYAASVGINTLDTAIAYGNSEECLGSIGVKDWQVISKIPEFPLETYDIQGWVRNSVQGSLERLKTPQLYGLLLHNPQQLLEPQGVELYDALNLLKTEGLVKKIGISVYSPEELTLLFNHFSFDLVQAPFNVVDRSLDQSGWLNRLSGLGVEVHVRSIFLQGLLLMQAEQRPAYFQSWAALWKAWEEWLLVTGITPLQACLAFVLHYPGINRVVVGVDSLEQLQEILSATRIKSVTLPDYLYSNDTDLINPAQWRLT